MKELVMGVVPVLIGIWGAIESFMRKYESTISYITQKVEEYSADGDFTSEEKEQLAIDTWRTQIRPNLPAKLWWVKLIPNVWMEKLIKNTIKDICDKVNVIKVHNTVSVNK